MRLKKQLFLTTLIISLPLTGPVQAVTAAEINNHDEPVRTSMRLPNEGRSDLQELITRVDSQVDTQSNKAPEAESTESEEPASSEDKAPAEKPNDTVKTDDNTKAKSKVKADIGPQAITTGTNGTSNWEFDSDKGLLTFRGGQLSERIDNNLSTAGIVNTTVKQIKFEGQVIAPTAVTYLFANLGQLNEFIALDNFDTSAVTSMSYWFYNSKGLTNLDLSSFDTSKVVSMSYMFYGTRATNLDLHGWFVGEIVTFTYMFYGASSLTTLNLNNWSVDPRGSDVNMSYMFSDTSALTTLNLKDFNTASVTNMSNMFYDTGLTSLDLSSWDVTRVTTFASMFQNASKLTSLNLSTWGANRTATTVNMSNMFYGTSALSTLNLTDFKTTNVTTMSNMFQGIDLTSLDLSNWDVTKVTTFASMFYNASKLKTLNLANWDTASLTSNNNMFTNTSELWQITLGEKIKFAGNPSFVNAPAANTKFTDDGQNYMVTTPSWQAVGSGTVHRPKGDLVTTTQMYADRAAPVTYVWSQAPTFDSLPIVNFGTLSASDFANEDGYVSSSGQTVSLINLAEAETYSIGVQQTDDWRADGESAIISRDTLSVALNTQSGVFWEGTSTTSEKAVTFQDDGGHFGLYFDKITTIPQSLLSKTLKSELTWTLNIVPDV